MRVKIKEDAGCAVPFRNQTGELLDMPGPTVLVVLDNPIAFGGFQYKRVVVLKTEVEEIDAK